MSNYNKVILLGRLIRDPELKVSQQGNELCNFSLAVSRKFKDKEEVAFIDCTCFGNTAKNVSKYPKKGDSILVEGRLNQDQWTDKEGYPRSKLKVVVEVVQFMGGGKGAKESSPNPTPSNTFQGNHPKDQVDGPLFNKQDEIPF